MTRQLQHKSSLTSLQFHVTAVSCVHIANRHICAYKGAIQSPYTFMLAILHTHLSEQLQHLRCECRVGIVGVATQS